MLASGRDFYWISWSDDLVAKAKAKGWEDFLTAFEVPAGMMPQQPDPVTVSLQNYCISAAAEFPEELAYEFSKFWCLNAKGVGAYTALADCMAKPEWVAYGINEDLAHPGAWRAWQEIGIRK